MTFIDGVKQVFEGIKTVFMFLYDNLWPFIKDNILMNAVDKVKKAFDNIKVLFESLGENISILFSEDADWWTRTKAFFGIFKAILRFQEAGVCPREAVAPTKAITSP